MATLHQIVIQRNEDLIRRFHEDRLPPHAALMNLKDAPQNHALGGGEIKPLPGALGPKIWEKGTKHETSLWVPKTYSNYREAFFKFIKHLYGNDVDMAGAKAYDVDHLFNRERASAGAMIRVEAVSASVNRSHGAGYEKTAGASTVAISRQAKMRPFTKIDFISVLKILGLPAPASVADKPRIDVIKQHSQKLGFTPDQIETGINNLLEIAKRR
jgi:hypothetical protein